MKLYKLTTLIIVVALLAGCDFENSDGVRKSANPQNKQCNQWCHNGWCSTHCDDVVASS